MIKYVCRAKTNLSIIKYQILVNLAAFYSPVISVMKTLRVRIYAYNVKTILDILLAPLHALSIAPVKKNFKKKF